MYTEFICAASPGRDNETYMIGEFASAGVVQLLHSEIPIHLEDLFRKVGEAALRLPDAVLQGWSS